MVFVLWNVLLIIINLTHIKAVSNVIVNVLHVFNKVIIVVHHAKQENVYKIINVNKLVLNHQLDLDIIYQLIDSYYHVIVIVCIAHLLTATNVRMVIFY